MSHSTKSVLIIEDEKALSQALDLKLSHLGFKTTVASDGESALKILKEEKFDLILLDLVMPKLDGFSVLENLDPSAKVIVLTNLSQKEDEAKAKKLGADGFFVKSDTPIFKVVEEINKLLGA